MIGSIMKLFLLGTTIGMFVQPLRGVTVLLVGLAVFEGWLLSAQFLGKLKPNPAVWTPDEMIALKKYSMYFRFPFASQVFSGVCSTINLLVLVWVPWLLWQKFWIPAAVLAANHFLVSTLAARLNPRFFLHDAVERGQVAFADEMLTVDRICEKLAKAG